MYPINNRKIITILFFAIFATYGNALLLGTFQFDDYNVIINNPIVHSWHDWWADVGHGIRPLLKLSYTLDWTSGLGPVGFHLTNLLIHGANTILVWLLTRHLIECYSTPNKHAQLISIATALLFAVHPVHTEAISYISGRSSSLMTVFYLGGILAHMLGQQKRHLFYLHGLTPLLFMAALAVKEVAITFPLALWFLDSLMGLNWRRIMISTWSSWGVFFAAVLFFLSNSNYEAHIARSLAMNDGLSNLAIQVNALSYLMQQWLFPLWLNIDPDLSHTSSLSLSSLILCSLVIFTLTIAVRDSNQHPWLKFALGWVLIQHFLVYLVFPRIDIANERQLYILSWPLLMALVAELARVLDARKLLLATCLLLVPACSITIIRNFDYRSEVALWQATAKLSPNKARVHNNLGYAYFLAGQTEQAREHYLRAIALDSNNYKARFNLETLNEKQAGSSSSK